MSVPHSAASAPTVGSSHLRVALVALCSLLAPWLAAWLPVVAQPQSYHDYADQQAWLGLAHAANVLSNVPFFIVGLIGIQYTLHGWKLRNRSAFADQRAAWPYVALFLGVLLTAFGSAWYHAAPNDVTLVWDRLPMALGFAGLVAGTLSDRVSQRVWTLLLAFSAVGVGTVIYWSVTGNLMPYLLMQAGFIAAALIATAWVASPYTHANRIYAAAGLYVVALILERLDHQVHAFVNGAVSGHTLKHLVACAALLIVYSMLRDRQQIAR